MNFWDFAGQNPIAFTMSVAIVSIMITIIACRYFDFRIQTATCGCGNEDEEPEVEPMPDTAQKEPPS